jgi:hypothetical protein
MFKDLLTGLNKFFNRKEFVITVIALLIAAALLSYTDNKTLVQDGYSSRNLDDEFGGAYSAPTRALEQPTVLETSAQFVVPNEDAAKYQMKPVNSPENLLPSDANSEWARLNPAMNAGTTPDLLQAGYHIGLDTIGQTLRNANLQLRSDPIIQKTVVGPWMQSTIEPDIARVPLEIGCVIQN